jgi:hypothetical protein
LPVAAATAAIIYHFAMHVPSGEYEPRPPKDAKKPIKKRKGLGFKPRRAVRLQELRREWQDRPFEDEPIDAKFANSHEGIMTKAVAVARAEAFRGAPELPQLDTNVACRTVRCRVDVCSKFPPELDLLTASMIELDIEGERLFADLHVENTTRGDLGKEPPGEPCFRITVAFSKDLPDREKIIVPGKRTGAAPPVEKRGD